MPESITRNQRPVANITPNGRIFIVAASKGSLACHHLQTGIIGPFWMLLKLGQAYKFSNAMPLSKNHER